MKHTENAASVISVLGVFNADLKFLVDQFPKGGETLHGLSFEVQPGGKGFNQAVACRRALTGIDHRHDVNMLTQLGTDNFGDLARKVMNEVGINSDNVLSSDKMPTGTAMIMVEKSTAQNMIVITPGAASLLNRHDITTFGTVIQNSDILITNFEVPSEVAIAGIEFAHSHGIRTMLDPAPALAIPDEIYRKLDYITPNESEAARIVGFEVKSLTDAKKAGEELCGRGVGTAIITMGGLGVVAVNEQATISLPAFEVEKIVDTTGAGDAFNGCFAAAITQDKNLTDSLRFASAGAALCVEKYGAAEAMAGRREIEKFLDNQN